MKSPGIVVVTNNRLFPGFLKAELQSWCEAECRMFPWWGHTAPRLIQFPIIFWDESWKGHLVQRKCSQVLAVSQSYFLSYEFRWAVLRGSLYLHFSWQVFSNNTVLSNRVSSSHRQSPSGMAFCVRLLGRWGWERRVAWLCPSLTWRAICWSAERPSGSQLYRAALGQLYLMSTQHFSASISMMSPLSLGKRFSFALVPWWESLRPLRRSWSILDTENWFWILRRPILTSTSGLGDAPEVSSMQMYLHLNWFSKYGLGTQQPNCKVALLKSLVTTVWSLSMQIAFQLLALLTDYLFFKNINWLKMFGDMLLYLKKKN